LAVDTLVFRDDGKTSFVEDPGQMGVKYCKHCRSWHQKLQLETGVEFCAFCNTTHHSRACRAGLGERCPDPKLDPIHEFMTRECLKHQKADLTFCSECNCFHSKQGWKICLENNRPKPTWSERKKLAWQTRWQMCRGSWDESMTMKSNRSLFDLSGLIRTVPYEYPFSNGKFVHHCKA
jgi:hypothetical protein